MIQISFEVFSSFQVQGAKIGGVKNIRIGKVQSNSGKFGNIPSFYLKLWDRQGQIRKILKNTFALGNFTFEQKLLILRNIHSNRKLQRQESKEVELEPFYCAEILRFRALNYIFLFVRRSQYGLRKTIKLQNKVKLLTPAIFHPKTFHRNTPLNAVNFYKYLK